MATVEKNIEKYLSDKVKELGGMALKFYCISFTGMLDRIILLPGGRVKLKSVGKVQSKRQMFIHALLAKLGSDLYVIYCQHNLNTLATGRCLEVLTTIEVKSDEHFLENYV